MADQRSYFVPFDLDTGGGTENVVGSNLRISASGGSIEAKGQQLAASSIPVVLSSDVNVVDTELPAAAALADATANPTAPGVGAFLIGFNGTTWDRVRTANTGRLQVDVITGGGSDTPTNPVTDTQTSVAVAAGASVDVDSSESAAKKLAWIDVWSSVAWKGEVHVVDNAVEGPRLGVCGGQAFQYVRYFPSHRDYVVVGTSAGADNFRLDFTNLDDNLAGDAHVVFHYED